MKTRPSRFGRYATVLGLFALGLGAFFLYSLSQSASSFRDLFREAPVTIDPTAAIVTRIQPLAQLVTITAYDELVADTSVRTSTRERIVAILNPMAMQVPLEKELIIVGKVTTHVGIDLKALRPEDVRVSGDTLYLRLPPAKVLDVVLNPSGTDVFVEEGKWPAETIQRLKLELQQEAAKLAVRRGYLRQAEERCWTMLRKLFLASGYRAVEPQQPTLSQ